MLDLILPQPAHRPLHVLCLGAHVDDIEIGCAGLMRTLTASHRSLSVCWAVMSAVGVRAQENEVSARTLLGGSLASLDVVCGAFDDGYLPAQHREVKGFFEALKSRITPDLVLTHHLDDRHQDHKLVAELTWNTFRDHLIFEYEIPKYEGDLGRPNVFVALTSEVAAFKVNHLMTHFESQRGKDWFNPGTFEAMMRLRGLECRSPSGMAEGFHARKWRLSFSGAVDEDSIGSAA